LRSRGTPRRMNAGRSSSAGRCEEKGDAALLPPHPEGCRPAVRRFSGGIVPERELPFFLHTTVRTVKSLHFSLICAAGTAGAHPVSFQGAWQVMLGGTDSVQNTEIYHSYSPQAAFGFHAMRFEGERDDDYYAGLQHNWLL